VEKSLLKSVGIQIRSLGKNRLAISSPKEGVHIEAFV